MHYKHYVLLHYAVLQAHLSIWVFYSKRKRWTNMHLLLITKVNCLFAHVKVSVTQIKTLISKWNIALSKASDTRRGKGLGETPQPPGHPRTLTPGRADCVILKCFRLQPDGSVKKDHTRRPMRTRRQIQFGIQLPHTNNSCEPDALQNYSLKHMHINGLDSRSSQVLIF